MTLALAAIRPRRACLLLLVCVPLLTSRATAESLGEQVRENLKHQALNMITQVDSYQAIQFLARQGDPETVMTLFHLVVEDLYWDKKNLTATIVLGRSAMQYGLTTAGRLFQADPQLAYRLTVRSKEMAYNLASYTWPGWNEQATAIEHGNLVLGQDAAKTNLRLTKALNLGDLPVSRAYWAVGAHHLAAGKLEGAKTSFLEAIRYAAAADAAEFVLMLRGYVYMVEILGGTSRTAMTTEFNHIRSELTGTSEGETYREQLETALAVFSKRPWK